MGIINISLPETLKSFVDRRVILGGYGNRSEYVLELIRKDQERHQLREKLLAGAGSASTSPVSGAYFDALRDRVRQAPRTPTAQ